MKEILKKQYKHLFLWMPFVMAFGAALYFSLDNEPIFRFPIIITILLTAIFFRYKNIIIKTAALFLFGFFYAMSFTHIINTPQIQDSFDFVNINGTVRDLSFTPNGAKLILHVPNYKHNENSAPQDILLRVSIKDLQNQINIGDKINGNIKTFHASGKYTPESFDFARWLYFQKISGTGFFQDYKIIPLADNDFHLRTYIHNKSHSMLSDALVLGYKQSIPEKQSEIWKTVGIGHVWSISGFHMTLVGGWLFAFFFFIFRAIAPLTRNIPAKYPAIICAWIGLVFYLCISGIGVATIRAFLMTTLIFGAILCGRTVFSLRNGVLAFLAIFLINPFFVMQAGFQLSFAAIFGLLWFFDNPEYVKRTRLQRLIYFVRSCFMSAFIGTAFTLPFVIAHFGYVPIYGLIGNVLLLPIFSIIIMPMVMIGTMCALFGNYFFLNLANNVYNYTLGCAEHISQLPFADLYIPAFSNTSVLLCILGILCLIFVVKSDSKNFFAKNINWVLCFMFVSCAITIYTTKTKPLFYSSDDNKLVGFVVDGKLYFNKSRDAGNFFAFNVWREYNHEKPQDKNERYKCNRGFCEYKTDKWKLVYMKTFANIMDNLDDVCADKSVSFIVTPFDLDAQNCHARVLKNGLLIYPNASITKITNRRPWHNQH